MNGFMPWRGTCKKYPILMHMFIEALCKFEMVVIDFTASTGGFTILIFTIDILFFNINESIDFCFIQCIVMLITHIFNIFFYKFLFEVPLSTHVVKVDTILLLIHEAYDIFFNKIFQPLREFSFQNPIVGQSSRPPSLEEKDESPYKVARKSCLST